MRAALTRIVALTILLPLLAAGLLACQETTPSGQALAGDVALVETAPSSERLTGDKPLAGTVQTGIGELYKAYRANEIAADQKYRGKTLYVLGIIAAIGRQEHSNKPYVSIWSPVNEPGPIVGKEPVFCFFDDTSGLEGLAAGDVVLVRGKGAGSVSGYPYLEHSTILIFPDD